MANGYFPIVFCIFLFFKLAKCQFPLVPALYVLGDSLVDSGNNNFLPTNAKVNYAPYGVDFPLKQATGRFTNGKTSVDFLAQLLGLPLVQPYLSLSPNQKKEITTGVNYASGSAGILPKSGTAMGMILPLQNQIDNFQRTVTEDLPNNFKTNLELSQYLAKSIFVISIGSNDYINNYLQPVNYNSSMIYTPEQFTTLLIVGLRQRLTRLYQLGARKVVVYGLGPIGCIPAIVNSANPKPTTPCVESVNNLILMYNTRLPGLLLELTVSLPLSTFVLADIYALGYAVNQNPALFGFTGGRTPCCVIGGNNGLCQPNATPCPDRTKNIYWDSFHPTEITNGGFANGCFNGFLCTPFNIQRLAMR